jgi:hypothetical protein
MSGASHFVQLTIFYVDDQAQTTNFKMLMLIISEILNDDFKRRKITC